MCFTIIRPFLACGRDRDRNFRVRHRQLAVFLRYSIVAGSTLGELIGLHFILYRALARERDASFHDCTDCIIAYQTVNVILRPALCCTIVNECFVLGSNCHCLWFDRQFSGFCSDLIVRCHIFSAVHDLIAFCDLIVVFCSIRDIRDTTRCCRFQLISCQELSACYCDRIVAVCTAVIRPLLACGCDRDCHFRSFHRQLAVILRYSIVAGSTLGELIGLHFILYRTLARERDASFHDCTDRIIAYQAGNVIAVIAVGSSVICELLALCCYCYFLRFDRQFSGCCCDRVVRCHIFSAVHDLIAFCDRVVIRCCICNICHTSRCCRYQPVSCQK